MLQESRFVIELNILESSKSKFVDRISIVLSFEHPLKALFPTLVRLVGNLMLDKDLHCSKAESLIFCKLCYSLIFMHLQFSRIEFK